MAFLIAAGALNAIARADGTVEGTVVGLSQFFLCRACLSCFGAIRQTTGLSPFLRPLAIVG
jgi:hypothetical protein